MLFESNRRQRILILIVAIVFSIVFAFMQFGFVGIPLPGEHVVYAVLQLLPVVLTSMLLGTLPGALVGLIGGSAAYVHSIIMPLNYLELALITPLSSIALFGICGLVSGLLFALFLREGRTKRQCIVGIALTCLITAGLFSVSFSVISLILIARGEAARLSVTEFAAVFDGTAVMTSARIAESALSVLMNTVLLGLPCAGTYRLAKHLSTIKDDIGVREAFGVSIFAIVVLAYAVTATFSFMTVTFSERERSEASVRSEVNYLCLQLEGLGERAEAFGQLAEESGMDSVLMTGSDLEAYRLLSDPVGDLLEGYTMAETGTVAILSDDIVLTTDDKRLTVGKNISELLGDDTLVAINESVRTGEIQRIPYDGILADSEDAGVQVGGTQIGYLLAGQQGDYTVMIIEPSRMFFKNRPEVMTRELAMMLVLLCVVFTIVMRLLSKTVARRIDGTNETLARITNGDLDARVEVGGTREFKALSSGINQTVDALQGWIAEAETRMDSELAAARAIQESTLPRTFPPFPDISEFDVYASMDPAREVGGDFYDFFLVGDENDPGRQKLGFVIADVSGKGVPASLFMMKAKTLIRDNMENGLGLNESVANANRQLCDGNGEDMFVTAWVGVLDYDTGHIDFVNAGHNPPLAFRNGVWEWIRDRSGMPLGLFDGLTYKTLSLDCEAGDKLLLYTDGVTEAFNREEEQYGEKRLEAVAEANKDLAPRELLEAVRSNLAAFVAGAEQSDDITILTLEVDSKAKVATFASR